MSDLRLHGNNGLELIPNLYNSRLDFGHQSKAA